jgi:ABC-type multidrug transport system fused ATPase/permease subunit
LITRFYLPTKGTISVDGTPIQDFSLQNFRRQFAAVFQDTTLFNDTLRFNLEFVRDGITFDQIREACREANILDFVESLPE